MPSCPRTLRSAGLRYKSATACAGAIRVRSKIVESSVGIFTATGSGSGPGSITNFVTQTEFGPNSLSAPATPGQIVFLWATGLGAARFPDNQPPGGASADVEFDQIEVWIGGDPVPSEDVLYAGRAPEFAGLDQIIVVVPADVPNGCYVPVHIRTNGSTVSNAATMAVGNCDATTTAPFRSGAVLLAAVRAEDGVDRVTPIKFSADLGLARVSESSGGLFGFNRLRALPPAGSCTTYGFAGRAGSLDLYRSPGDRALSLGDRLRRERAPRRPAPGTCRRDARAVGRNAGRAASRIFDSRSVQPGIPDPRLLPGDQRDAGGGSNRPAGSAAGRRGMDGPGDDQRHRSFPTAFDRMDAAESTRTSWLSSRAAITTPQPTQRAASSARSRLRRARSRCSPGCCRRFRPPGRNRTSRQPGCGYGP